MKALQILITILILGTQITFSQSWPNVNLRSICSNGINRFIIVGENGSVFLSTDKGESWNYKLNVNGFNSAFADVYFSSELTCYIVGDNGIILKSIDGGYSWTQKNFTANANLEAIHFSSQNNGITVGGKMIFRTSDAGETWVKISVAYSEPFHDIAFLSPANGIIVSSYQSTPSSLSFYITNDSGKTWGAISNKIYALKGITQISSNSYIAVGDYGIYLSTNNGSGWQQVKSGLTNGLLSVAFIDSLYGIATGFHGYLLKTIDGGKNWEIQPPTATNASNIKITISGSTIILITDQQTLYRSTDQGLTWNSSKILEVELLKNNFPLSTMLSQNYPNPFNPETSIQFSLTKESMINLSIFDLTGKIIVTLIDGHYSSGDYSLKWKPENISTGTYYCKLKTNNTVELKKMLYLK